MSEGTRADEDAVSPSSIPEPGWRVLWGWITGRVTRLQVSGRSMVPTLVAGETVWVDTHAYRRRVPRVGELVVAMHPFQRGQLLIKRVGQVHGDGHVELRGDNPSESTDSRGLGLFPVDRVIGRVWARSFA